MEASCKNNTETKYFEKQFENGKMFFKWCFISWKFVHDKRTESVKYNYAVNRLCYSFLLNWKLHFVEKMNDSDHDKNWQGVSFHSIWFG